MQVACVIIDDEPDAQRLIERYCEKVGQLQVMAKFSDAVAALQYVNTHEVDLIFLDVQMPELSGFEFMKLLSKQVKIILTTAYSSYSLQAFEYNVIDYLLTPITFDRFLKAVTKVTMHAPSTALPRQVRLGDTFESAHFVQQILYVEAFGNYAKAHFQDSFKVIHETMKNLEEVLTPFRFIRCHKSYIVNLQFVQRSDDTQWLHTSKGPIPIGISYRQRVRQAMR